MEISFDYKTKQKILKLNGEEEGLLIHALNIAEWNTHSEHMVEYCKKLQAQLKDERLSY